MTFISSESFCHVPPPPPPPSLPADTDGWSGQFSGGQEYPLLWKEGDVYLLPLSEDDLGFYSAPGERDRADTHTHTYTKRADVTFKVRYE